MAIEIPDFAWIGSFQRGATQPSENPLEEVWAQIARIGTVEYAKSLTPTRRDINWDEHIQYACVRVQQALELRRAGAGASILTKPITLYYSFLNLLRAFMALGPEVVGPSGHGLLYRPDKDLLLNEAEFSTGTFTAYLSSDQVAWSRGTRISLKSALSKIPEICEEFRSSGIGQPNALPVFVETRRKAKTVRLCFHDDFVDEQAFRSRWTQEFPTLSRFELEEKGAILKLKQEHTVDSYEAICSLCNETLLNSLLWSDHPLWYVIRDEADKPTLPRAAYYIVAIFILGNIARYQPELLQPLVLPASGSGWFFERLLRTSERFFPQLMIRWGRKSDIYFTTY